MEDASLCDRVSTGFSRHVVEVNNWEVEVDGGGWQATRVVTMFWRCMGAIESGHKKVFGW